MKKQTKKPTTTKPTTTEKTETITTPTTITNNETPTVLSEPSSLDKVIEETKNEINNHEEVKEKERGGGRKKKDLTIQPKMQTINPMQYKEALSAILSFSGVYLAKVSKWEGFELSKEEVELLATQGSDIAVEFMPAVESKYVKLGAFALTITAVYGMRYMEFKDIHAQRLANKPPMSETGSNEIQTN